MIEFLLGLATYVMVVLVAGTIFFVVGPPIIHWLMLTSPFPRRSSPFDFLK